MKRQFSELSKEKYDLVVVGGGIIGTGLARDAALRGIKTLLLEKEDFAYGTSSRSTRLIHGGLRYLSHFDFKLVRQDLREREILLKIAPHLVKPLPFLLPLTSMSQRSIMAAGMRLYDLLSYDKSVPSYQHLSRRQTNEIEPGMRMAGLKGSYRFYDCQVSFPERLCIENALSAADSGAVLVNHAEVTGITVSDHSVETVQVKDCLSRDKCEVHTRAVVNAAGHWADGIMKMAVPSPMNTIVTTMGIHLVTPKLSNNALVIFAKSDGRLIFVIPWEGYSLIGTTDTEYSGDKDFLVAQADHVAYIAKEVRQVFPNFKVEDVYYAMAGLRSLVGSRGQKVSNISRSHKLVDHEVADRVGGFVSILGGKITGYRSIAQEAVDLVCKKLAIQATSSTAETALPGAPGSGDELGKLAEDTGLSLETLTHFNSLYGTRLSSVAEMATSDAHGKEAICPHSKDVIAQIWHAVKEESCLTVSDFMLRRGTVGLASCQGLDAVEVVGLEMGRLLEWSIGEFQRQVGNYRDFVAAGTQFKKSGSQNAQKSALARNSE